MNTNNSNNFSANMNFSQNRNNSKGNNNNQQFPQNSYYNNQSQNNFHNNSNMNMNMNMNMGRGMGMNSSHPAYGGPQPNMYGSFNMEAPGYKPYGTGNINSKNGNNAGQVKMGVREGEGCCCCCQII